VTTVELKVWAALVALNGAARSVQRVWPGRRSRKAMRVLDGRSYLVSLEPHPGGRRPPAESVLRELS
jgi:hypothetical protein